METKAIPFAVNPLEEKRIFLITGPSGGGKSSLGFGLAEALYDSGLGVSLIDKDVTCSYVSNEMFRFRRCRSADKIDRECRFFSIHLRSQEVLGIINGACLQIPFCDNIIIPAPMSREMKAGLLHGEHSPLLRYLYEETHKRGAKLIILYVSINEEEARRRMRRRYETDRNAFSRIPQALKRMEKRLRDNQWAYNVSPDDKMIDCDRFIVFNGMQSDESFEQLKRDLGIHSAVRFDPDVVLRPVYATPPADLLDRLLG